MDPNILFNWSVDDPSPTLSCQAGLYTGSFTGFYASAITVVGVPIPVFGDVNLTLQQSANGEFYTISNGSVHGTADGILAQYDCKLTGTLDCSTKKLEDGLIDCNYCVGVFAGDSGICLGVEGHFVGPVSADYDAANQSFENGDWKGKEGADAAVFGGSGHWTAAYGP